MLFYVGTTCLLEAWLDFDRPRIPALFPREFFLLPAALAAPAAPAVPLLLLLELVLELMLPLVPDFLPGGAECARSLRLPAPPLLLLLLPPRFPPFPTAFGGDGVNGIGTNGSFAMESNKLPFGIVAFNSPVRTASARLLLNHSE